MVKNKALPDSARLCCTPRLVSLSLSPSQTWPYQGWSHVSSLPLSEAVHPEGTPWILPRLDPGSCQWLKGMGCGEIFINGY